VFRVGDRLFADTETGIAEQSNNSWRIISKRRSQDSFGHAHVGAIAAYRDRIVAGFFDGGLAELVPALPSRETPLSAIAKADSPMILRSLAGQRSPEVWAVNALLEAGGALHIASLRGAFRFDGSSITAVEGSGAAFSLAQIRGGVAIGYGEGVLLPEGKLLSAFHGLPGNQATALAAAAGGLLVGTPSGLGFVSDLKVRWRVASGEGKLPHPWVTAILPLQDGVLLGTYGGGLTRRVGSMSDQGEWKPFPETAGLKINTGCLVIAKSNGRIYAGTDGTGLFRLSLDGSRFERLKLSLPSKRITALLERDGLLYIGTDEGLTRWPVEQDIQP
jgi:ligand-binding sensor domain-containing protein